jgi:predicted enzyme related to lactoylglutathione lyase
MSDVFKTHGAVSWTELLTTDTAQSKAFYQTLFDWRFEDMIMENGDTYCVIHVGESPIGGIMKRPQEAGDSPPTWGSYVTVSDLDATIAAARSHDGVVLDGPRDIPDVGRCALVQDPQGAVIHAIEYNMCDKG